MFTVLTFYYRAIQTYVCLSIVDQIDQKGQNTTSKIWKRLICYKNKKAKNPIYRAYICDVPFQTSLILNEKLL